MPDGELMTFPVDGIRFIFLYSASLFWVRV